MKIFLGIDVHKNSFSYCFVKEGTVDKKGSLVADIEAFVKLIKKLYPDSEIESAYEAGFSGFDLHYALKKAGIDSFVIDPGSVIKAPNDRVKTDAIDAKKLASHLEKGLLTPVHVPTRKEIELRSLSRVREQMVEMRKATANRIKSFLLFNGYLRAFDSRRISNKFLKEHEAKLSGVLRESFRYLCDQWREQTLKLYEIRKKFISLAESDKELKIYQSVPGIGVLTALTLKLELGDIIGRFKSQKKLYSYTGLTPTEYSSGDKDRKGHISRKGPPRIRKMLVESAWIAIRYDNSLRQSYNEITQRRGAKIAIVAIARKLIGRLRSCLKKKTLYVSEPINIG